VGFVAALRALSGLEARFPNKLPAIFSLHLQVFRKVGRRVEYRDYSNVDQAPLPKAWLIADASDLVMQLLNYVLRRAGGRNEAEIHWGKIGKSQLRERRNIRKER